MDSQFYEESPLREKGLPLLFIRESRQLDTAYLPEEELDELTKITI
jgi:hypothetical protein